MLVVVLGAATGLFGLLRAPLEGHGWRLAPHTWLEPVVILALGGFIFALAWQVRQFQQGKRPSLDPLRAARTLVLAKAGAITGMILGGRYLAAALSRLDLLSQPSVRARFIASAITLAACLALTIAALIAERFCQLPPQDDPEQTGREQVGREQAGQEQEPAPARFADSEPLAG